MKIGRNAPCPCGSGKKYKHCCLNAAAKALEASEELLVFRRARRALEGFPPRLLNFADDVYGEIAVHEAWEEFFLWPEDDEEAEFDPMSPFLPVFMPWFFHHWTPDIETEVADRSLDGQSPTAEFLRRRGERLEPMLRRYLEACLEAPFSFHEILSASPGHGFRARDVLTGEEQQVLEQSASEIVRQGDILYGQLVEVDGIVMLETASPVLLPPIDKIEIMELRSLVAKQTHVAASRERLRELEFEIRELYLALASRVLYPQLPELRNTDGELIVMHRLVFDIDSAEDAFNALKHLCVTRSEDELLAAADRDAHGNIEHVEITWSKPGNTVHRELSNTSLGRIEIRGTRLEGEVNSAERAERLRTLIEDALGERARYRATEIQDIEQALGEEDEDDATDSLDADELAELPEVKAQMREMMAAHYEDWVSMELPALGGRTPLQAVAEPDGRERVEALLCDFERRAERMGDDPALLRRVRERLGLAKQVP